MQTGRATTAPDAQAFHVLKSALFDNIRADMRTETLRTKLGSYDEFRELVAGDLLYLELTTDFLVAITCMKARKPCEWSSV